MRSEKKSVLPVDDASVSTCKKRDFISVGGNYAVSTGLQLDKSLLIRACRVDHETV